MGYNGSTVHRPKPQPPRSCAGKATLMLVLTVAALATLIGWLA